MGSQNSLEDLLETVERLKSELLRTQGQDILKDLAQDRANMDAARVAAPAAILDAEPGCEPDAGVGEDEEQEAQAELEAVKKVEEDVASSRASEVFKA